MQLLGPYVEVTTKNENGLDLAAMIEKTKQEMEAGTEVICEASFSLEGNYCAVDILRKTKDGWAIYEVKSSSFPEFDGQEAKLEKYAPDIAYQKLDSLLRNLAFPNGRLYCSVSAWNESLAALTTTTWG